MFFLFFRTVLAASILGVVCCIVYAKPVGGVNLEKLSDWSIVLDASASPAEAYVAEELQRLLAEASYGVYTFLEDYLGIRFLTHDHTFVPKVGGCRVIGPVDRTVRPPLQFRWSYYGVNQQKPEFGARLRVNAVSDDPRLGGRTGLGLVTHSFHEQLPAEEYGEDHPEYYALVDGIRKLDGFYDGPQLCLSNPEVLKRVTTAVLEQLAVNPAARNVSVSQTDHDNYCRCEPCAAIDEREGSPMGSILTFVNAVADEVAKARPDVSVGIL